MKRKILALGVFSLCCLGLFVAPAQAFFGLFSPWNSHNRYTTQITCRPYNAFTPIAWGNLVCDGCCPNPCAVASGCMPMCGPSPCCGAGIGLPYMGAPCMGGSCGSEGCCASDMPMQPMQMPMQQMPMQMPMPDIRNQPYGPAMPMSPNHTMAYPAPQNGVAQANYYPGYYPAAYPSYTPNYPMNYNPYLAYPMAPMPYYWYGSGR